MSILSFRKRADRSSRSVTSKGSSIALLIFISVLPLALLAPPVGAANDPTQPATGGTAYVTGNWTVTVAKAYHDCTIVVSGNITVASGGSLGLSNVTLKMNSTFEGQYTITVGAGGAFRAYNGTVITASNVNNPFKFDVNATGTLEFDNVTLSHCGRTGALPPEWQGLYVESDNVRINGSDLSNNEYGIIDFGGNITVTNSSLTNNNYHGIWLSGSMDSRIENVNVSWNGYYGMAVLYSNLTRAKGILSTNNSYDGIATYKSNLTMKNVISRDNQRLGILSQSAQTTVYDSSFVNNAFFDVYATGHNQTGMTGPGKVDLYNVKYTTYHLHDPTQSLNSSYSTNVSVVWKAGGGVPGADVTIYNNSLASDGGISYQGKTDANGKISGLMLKVLEDSQRGKWFNNPFTAKAVKDGKVGQSEANISGPWTIARITIDPSLPASSITSPAEGTLLNNSTVKVRGTAGDFDGVDRVEVSWNGTGWSKAAGNESWSLDLTLPDGKYRLLARSFDKLGNIGGNATVNITIDTVLPQIEIDSPSNGTLVNTTNVTVSGKAEAGAILTSGGKAITNDNGNFSFIPALPSDGPNTITVTATDKANNSNAASITVYRDTKAPLINVTWPPPGSGTKDDMVLVQGQLTGAQNLSFTNGKIHHEITVVNGLFNHDMPVFEGRNDIVLRAVDDAGNAATHVVTVIRDTTEPPLDVQWPNISFTRERHLSFRIITEPGANVTVNGQPVEDADKDGNITYILDLHQGQNGVTVEATDWLGNSNRTWRGVQADFSPPSLVIDNPKEGDVLTSQQVNIFGIAGDDMVVMLVEAKVDNLQWSVCVGTETWSKTLVLDKGPHMVSVRASDLVGNNVTLTVNFSVLPDGADVLKPDINITWPKAGMTLVEGPVTITGKAFDDVSVKSVEWSQDGTTWKPCVGTNYWNLTVNLTKGVYTYYFKVTDGSGKSTLSSVSFKVKEKGTGGHISGGNPYMLWVIVVLVAAIVIVAIYFVYMGKRDTKAIEEEERIERRGAADLEDEEIDDSEE